MTIKETLQITIPALPRPTLKEIKKEWSWIERIEKDESTTEAVTLNLATVLNDGESSISGTEYEKRLATIAGPKLGWQHRKWLVEHQDEFPEFMALIKDQWMYIDFPGLVVVSDGGGRFVPYCFEDGARWVADWGWLGCKFDVNGRVAVAGQVARTLGESDTSALGHSDPLHLDISEIVAEWETVSSCRIKP